MTIFILFTCVILYQFHFITSPLLLTENNKLWNEKKEHFFYMTTSSYLIISKEVENLSLDTIAFLGTHVY